MSRLTKICGREFMGGNFVVELGPLTIVRGRNDMGKTRLGNLIKVLLLGHLPSLHNKARDIFDRLASGKRMEVEGVFDDGEAIHRSWEEKGQSVKSAKFVPARFDEKTPLVLLDHYAYFGQTPRGRVEMVFAVAKVDFKPTDVLRVLHERHGVFPQVAIQDVPPQEWLEAALEWTEKERSAAAAEAKRYTGTLQGVTELQLRDEPSTRSVEEIDEEIDKERAAASEKSGRRTALVKGQEAAEQTELERDALAHKIKDAGDPPVRDYDIAALRTREKELATKAKAIRDALDDHAKWKREEASRFAQVERVREEIARINAAVSRIPELEKKLEGMKPKPAAICPKCKQPVGRGDPEHPDATRIRNELAGIRADQTWLTAKEKELARIETAAPEPRQPTEDIDALEAELGTVRREIDEYVATAEVQSWRRQLAALPKADDKGPEIAALATEIQAHEATVRTLQEERRAAETERADRRRLTEAKEAQDKAVENEKRYKEAKAYLIEKKGELIEEVFGPLLKTAARFMRGIFETPVEYRDGELGMFNGSTWVTEATFGDAKRAMLYAALKCALGSGSPCRIIEMDRLEVIDAQNTAKFLENIKGAHAEGLFDQFIGTTPRFDGAPAGFTIIEATGKGYVTA